MALSHTSLHLMGFVSVSVSVTGCACVCIRRNLRLLQPEMSYFHLSECYKEWEEQSMSSPGHTWWMPMWYTLVKTLAADSTLRCVWLGRPVLPGVSDLKRVHCMSYLKTGLFSVNPRVCWSSFTLTWLQNMILNYTELILKLFAGVTPCSLVGCVLPTPQG